jgi:antitoxin VapB
MPRSPGEFGRTLVAITGVFKVGRRQAVRLPREFWQDTDAMTVRREGDNIILEPVPKSPAWVARWRAKYPPEHETPPDRSED